MASPHKDAVDRARLDAERAKHALAVVDRVTGDLEPFAPLGALLADIDAIDGACLGALVTGDAGR